MKIFYCWLNLSIIADPLEQFEVVNFLFFNSYTILLMVNLVLLVLFFFKRNYFSFFLLSQLFFFFSGLYKNIFGLKHQGAFFYFFFIFLFIFFNNIIGMFPYTYTLTSFFLLTFFLSFSLFFGILFIGFEKSGWAFFSFFYPKNVPIFILYFLIFIELISYFIRLFSLAIRLFANMVAGHALLKILLSFIWLGITSLTIFSLISGVFWVFILVITILEILIAFLQAYVFVFLGLIYFSEVLL